MRRVSFCLAFVLMVARVTTAAPPQLPSVDPTTSFDSTNDGGGPRIHRVYVPTPTGQEVDSIVPSGSGFANPLANMTYHGASVMTSVTAYTIFWVPPGRNVSPAYQSLINRYFQDIGGSSFFGIVTQYYQEPPRQYIQNASTLGGTWVDTAPYPNTVLLESDLQQEVQKAIAVNQWPTGYNVMFFVYTARGVESCLNDYSACTPGEAQVLGRPGYCAYHSAYGTVAQPVIWANMPYGATWNGNPAGQCTALSQFPNDADSDITISTTSHEHFEAVTDPVFYRDVNGLQYYGWTDTDGGSGEIGDKCAYRYGAIQSDGGNVTLNGHRYVIQQEWSNWAFNGAAYSGCALSYSPRRFRVRGDFDGDGKAEITVFRPSTGEWFARLSSLGFSTTSFWRVQWGLPGDIPIAGDFDGDGVTDLTVWRPSTGTWYVRYSSLGYDIARAAVFQWGLPGDVPLAGDFDGDGKTDLTVWRPSTGTWYVRYSTLGYDVASAAAFQWGLPGDVPIVGDYDGDGKAELTVWRPATGEWFARLSSLGFSATNFWHVQWGLPGDIPIAGDFDGDGVTDLTVWRPSTGTWYVRYSSLAYDIARAAVFQWGLPGDEPLARDFDGDGKTDLVVWRPSIGGWFILFSSEGYAVGGSAYFQWGLSGDLMVEP